MVRDIGMKDGLLPAEVMKGGWGRQACPDTS